MINDFYYSSLNHQFEKAEPFRHVIIDDFFDEAKNKKIQNNLILEIF